MNSFSIGHRRGQKTRPEHDAGPGLWLTDTEPQSVDIQALVAGRLSRLRQMMSDKEYGGLVLFDPHNQRYSAGSRNMSGRYLRDSGRYLFVSIDGPIVLFEYPTQGHVSDGLFAIDEVRHSALVWTMVNQLDESKDRQFASEIADLVKQYGGGSMRVGLDRCSQLHAISLEDAGCDVEECQGAILHVRQIKTRDEIDCIRLSMAVAEFAVFEMREKIRPGVSEQELFAELCRGVVAHGGEYLESRYLASGPRTNPWFKEASGRKVRPGELVALNADVTGCFGYNADLCRTFYCGPGKPNQTQKSLYAMAIDQVLHNSALVRPGLSFREIADKAWPIPEEFLGRRYTSIMHGVGMHGEGPRVMHAVDYDTFGQEGVLKPGMVMSVESFIAKSDGAEGVRLNCECAVTETGHEVITRFPFEDVLATREL